MSETNEGQIITPHRVNCYNCGRFVGPDGDLDVGGLQPSDEGLYDGWEPECRRCIDARTAMTPQTSNETVRGRGR